MKCSCAVVAAIINFFILTCWVYADTLSDTVEDTFPTEYCEATFWRVKDFEQIELFHQELKSLEQYAGRGYTFNDWELAVYTTDVAAFQLHKKAWYRSDLHEFILFEEVRYSLIELEKALVNIKEHYGASLIRAEIVVCRNTVWVLIQGRTSLDKLKNVAGIDNVLLYTIGRKDLVEIFDVYPPIINVIKVVEPNRVMHVVIGIIVGLLCISLTAGILLVRKRLKR